MAKHSVPHGEEGTKTSQTRGNATYDGRHREGVAPGTATQQQQQRQEQNQQIAGHDDH